MSRAGLIKAFTRRANIAPALVPLIGLHAAHLEQVDARRYLTDPEVQARALRNAQALYDTDAVTAGAWLELPAAAARLVALGRDDPLAAGADTAPLVIAPDVEAVVAHPLVQTEFEAMRRLRPVLGGRSGIALVLPTPGKLHAQLGGKIDRAWCLSLLMRILRLMGGAEPDVLLAVGDDDLGPRVATLCDHFGLQWVALGRNAPAGVAATDGDRFTSLAAEADGHEYWLYTSTSEVPAETDPRTLKAALAALSRIRSRGAGVNLH